MEKFAVKAITRIQDIAIGDPLWRTRLELSQMREHLEQLTVETTHESARQCQQRQIHNHMIFFRAQLGLTCCDENTSLFDTHMQCLDSTVARGLWTVEKFLSTDTSFSFMSYRCGWPDCEKYLPPQYTWFDERLDDAYAERWHCVVCEGNSKLQSNGWLQPAR